MSILNFFTGYILVLLSTILVSVGVIGYGITAFGLDYIGKVLPTIKLYSKPLQVVSVILLSLGCLIKGGLNSDTKWESKVKIAQEQIKSLEAQQKLITVVYKDRLVKQLVHDTSVHDSNINAIHNMQVIAMPFDSLTVRLYNDPILERTSK